MYLFGGLLHLLADPVRVALGRAVMVLIFMNRWTDDAKWHV